MKKRKSERDHIEEAREKLLAAILPHVEFDGWSAEAYARALSETGLTPDLASGATPRGAVDLAASFHRAGDQAMVSALSGPEFEVLSIREKIAFAIRWRISFIAPYREQVRRALSLYAMPAHMGEGTEMLWKTADLIWNAAGDTAQDANYYTKRTILSAVYSATLLYWLSDDSEEFEDSWAFLDRRIENVMQFEKLKANVLNSPVGGSFSKLMESFRKPDTDHKRSFPGYSDELNS